MASHPLLHTVAALPDGLTVDVAVVGAGGAGLACALFAALQGAQVLLVEHTGLVGGTTAMSAGTAWIPGTQHAATVNAQDTLAQAALYLDHAVGNQSPQALRQAFLDQGGKAVQLLEERTAVQFRPYPKHPDYISDLPGSTLCGRALEPLPFDGRLLGPLFSVLRPPIPEFTVLGGMMVDRTDINHLLALTKSWASFAHACKLLARHARDRLTHPRGTRLVMGNALVARLLHSIAQFAPGSHGMKGSVRLLLNTTVASIGQQQGAVHQITLRSNDADTFKHVTVRGGVVLASGGFNRQPQERATRLPGVPPEWCPGAPGHTGAAQSLAKALGAAMGTGTQSDAFWAPVSLRKRADGSTAVFPHFVLDRAKPGCITVNHAGRRFVNESTSYHLFASEMRKQHALSQQGAPGVPPCIPAWMVADATALQKYGMGMVRPGASAGAMQPFLADGYLVRGDSLADLARQIGVPADALAQTVARFNTFAASGVDEDFHRGETAYQQNLGDATLLSSSGLKNPNLGPLQTAPFYALRLHPGDIGACTGLTTDAHARVLDAQQQPIAGLYAVGNDMQSMMGGVYPAPGITIGPGIVFASLAAADAVGRAAS